MKSIDIVKKMAAALVLAGLSAAVVRAQTLDLPVIPDDPSVVVSRLSCGMSFYYVPNPSAKNLISLALVQIPDSTMQVASAHSTMQSASTPDAIQVTQTRELAAEAIQKASFHNLPLKKFLASNGVLPKRKGYVSVDRNIIYQFDSLSLSRGDAALDSVLFAVFNIAGQSVTKGIPPASQALIVAGDVYYDNIRKKVDMLSLLCPKVEGENHPAKYKWEEPKTWQLQVEEGRVSKITAQWKDARIPDHYIKTVLPAISTKMSWEFGWVLRSRLHTAFRSRGIYVWMNYDFKGSANTQGDETSTLVVYCPKTETETTKKIITEELDRLLTYGIGEEEYCYFRDANRYSALKEETAPVQPNEREVKRCVSHFLCGASLATGLATMKFEYRQMPDSMQTRLFNNYVIKRLSVGSHVDTSLAKAPALVSRDSILRILAHYVPQLSVKMPKDKDEYFSAGRKWTCPNGPIVIHKKMSPSGLVRYCYAVKGGSRWADVDYLSCIDGVSASTLSLFLASIGATMDVKITPACVYLSGSVPAENFDTMVNVLAAISRQQENDKLFSAGRYKLFVTAGPLNYEDVKKVMGKYAAAFGPSTGMAGGMDVEGLADMATETSSRRLPTYAVVTEFPLDLSSKNLALSRVARLVLRDKLGVALSESEATTRIGCGFKDYPEEKYRITLTPSKEEYRETIVSVLKALAAETMDAGMLKKYVACARDEFFVFKSTPQYYIDGVVRRYVDFKDLYTDFDAQAQKISAADLNEFFTAALINIK